jgi:CubicO group peptidase (beta-lactamase class C family)
VRRAEGGAELDDIVRRRIFAPLGMAHSDVLGEASPLLTTPYHRAPGEDARFQLERAGVQPRDEPTVDGHNIRGAFGGEFNKAMLAAGGAQSTVPDMARYASALLRGGAGIVRPETFASMIAPQFCPEPRLVNWGLSFIRYPRYGRTFIGHGGAYFGGWNSNLAVLPDEGIGIIVHMNVMMDEPGPIYHSIWRAVLGIEDRPVAYCATDASILASAPGTYELPPGRLTNHRPAVRLGRLQIEREGDALLLRSRWGSWKHGVRLQPCDPDAPDLFAVSEGDAEPAHIVLTRGADGAVTGLRCDDLVYMMRRE